MKSSLCNPHKKVEHDVMISSGIPEVSQSVTVTVTALFAFRTAADQNCCWFQHVAKSCATLDRIVIIAFFSYSFILLPLTPPFPCVSLFLPFSFHFFPIFLFSFLKAVVRLYDTTFWQQ